MSLQKLYSGATSPSVIVSFQYFTSFGLDGGGSGETGHGQINVAIAASSFGQNKIDSECFLWRSKLTFKKELNMKQILRNLR